MYYRGAKAALVVYDMTAAVYLDAYLCMRSLISILQDSFEAAKKWVVELRRRGEPDVVIALAGNKCDLVADKKVDSDVSFTSYACPKANLNPGSTRVRKSKQTGIHGVLCPDSEEHL